MSSDDPREDAVGGEPEVDESDTSGVDDTPGAGGDSGTESAATEAENAADTDSERADSDSTDSDGAVSEDATEGADSEDADSEGATEGEPAPAGGGRSRNRELLPKRLVLASSALALAAVIVAAVFGGMWLFTATGDRAELASARSSVSDTARSAVQAFTELDYKNPDQYFKSVKAVSTEKLGKQLSKTEKNYRKALTKAKTTVTTDVLDVAVQELNTREGTATFLSVIRTHITQGDKKATKVLRLKGTMERVSSDGSKAWKLAGLQEVPVVGPGGKQGQQQQPTTGSGKNAGAPQSNGGK